MKRGDDIKNNSLQGQEKILRQKQDSKTFLYGQKNEKKDQKCFSFSATTFTNSNQPHLAQWSKINTSIQKF